MSTFTALTRPTRRDMRRHPWRTLAAFLMILVPVALLTGLYMVDESTQTQNALREQRNTIWVSGSAECTQTAEERGPACTGPNPQLPVQRTLEAALPDFNIASTVDATVDLSAGGLTASINVIQVSYSPATALPGPNEVYLPTEIMQRLGVNIGDTVTAEGHGTWTITGRAATYQAVVAAPTLLDPATVTTDDALDDAGVFVTWHAVGSETMTWEDVQRLNAQGFIVESKDLHQHSALSDQIFIDVLAWATLLVAMIFLFLFVTPVFSLAAGKQARTYALMRSQGATRGHIRQSVVAYGLFTGLIGATAGVLLGIGAASAYWLVRYPEWPLAIDVPTTGVIWLGAVIGAFVAAFIPAIITTRLPLAAAIAGGAPDKMLRFRPWMLLGLVFLAVGIGLSLLTSASETTLYSAAGLEAFSWPAILLFVLARTLSWPLIVIGLAGCAPLLVWLVSKAGSSLSTVPRLAMRDVARQSLRSVPIVALVLVTSFITVSGITGSMASSARSVSLSNATFNSKTMFLFDHSSNTLPDDGYGPAIAAVEQVVGPTSQYQLTQVATDLNVVADSSCVSGGRDDDSPETARQCYPQNKMDFISLPVYTTLVADKDTLRAFRFPTPEAERRALDALQEPAVLVAEGTAPQGTGDIWIAPKAHNEGPIRTNQAFLDVLPGHAGPPLITAALAEQLDLETEPGPMLLEAREPMTDKQAYALTDYFSGPTIPHSFTAAVQSGQPRYLPALTGAAVMLLILVVVALTLALSTASTNRQFALLRAVGADPSIPRRISGTFASILVLLGTVAGSLAGVIFAWITASSDNVDAAGNILLTGSRGFMEIHWDLLGILVLLTPALAYAVGILFHREGPMEVQRRQ
ncbi:FtsX-like permease family protein [Corynebacterium pilosum]|uniref:ABC transporter permease n=1 Tax=Corynebacterium pilosum TaxID=35756 RepID=A0A376CQN0_9CORY|nr:FtsX-like permease family protein [Corynebacterium pilosum]STC69958.1 ABC transporter permease [Corynebacterium pilosum]